MIGKADSAGGQMSSAIANLPEARGRRWLSRIRRRSWIAAVLASLALVVATGADWGATVRKGEGTFRAEPPACQTLTASVHLLGGTYALRPDDANNCNLLLPGDSRLYGQTPVISVSYHVAEPADGDASRAASQILHRAGNGLVPLVGVADEAFSKERSVYLRVRNLVIVVAVFPVAASTQTQIRDFAADVALRLRTSS